MKQLFFLLTLLLAVPSVLKAEDVLSHIPKNASFIMTFNGDVFNKKMSFEEMNKLPFVQKMLREQFSTDSSADVSITDLGINLTSRSAFFAVSTDSMMYFNYIFQLGNTSLFKAFIGRKGVEVKTDDQGNNFIIKDNSILVWNNEYAIMTWGELSEAYNRAAAYTDPYSVVVDSVAVDTMATPDYYNKYEEDSANTYEEIYPEDYNYTDPYASYLTARSEAKIRLLKSLYMKLFKLDFKESVAADHRFMKHQDNTSEVIFWVGTHKELMLSTMKNYLGGYYYQYEIPVNSPVFSEENYTISKLTFNKNDIRIDTEGHMDPRIVKHYKKISKASVNKKFFKYVKGDNLFGYMGSAVNTRAFLEESPQMWKYYLEMFPYTHDISEELIDLIFLFVDKKAIGKLFKGDFLVAFTGLSRKEVEYTSYEYDSLFVLQEVVKTKMQTYPEFVFMYSTKDMENTNKFFSILHKKKLLEKKDGYYTTNLYNQSPFSLHFVIKKGIVFMCNSDEQLQAILKGGTKGSLSGTHKKLIRKHAFSLFIDVQNILTNMKDPDDKITNPMLAMGIEKSRQLYAYGEKVKGGVVRSEVKLITPDSEVNSFRFLIDLMNSLEAK